MGNNDKQSSVQKPGHFVKLKKIYLDRVINPEKEDKSRKTKSTATLIYNANTFFSTTLLTIFFLFVHCLLLNYYNHRNLHHNLQQIMKHEITEVGFLEIEYSLSYDVKRFILVLHNTVDLCILPES